jgi:hypothetical protein
LSSLFSAFSFQLSVISRHGSFDGISHMKTDNRWIGCPAARFKPGSLSTKEKRGSNCSGHAHLSMRVKTRKKD